VLAIGITCRGVPHGGRRAGGQLEKRIFAKLAKHEVEIGSVSNSGILNPLHKRAARVFSNVEKKA
jgi:hypothetical protein